MRSVDMHDKLPTSLKDELSPCLLSVESNTIPMSPMRDYRKIINRILEDYRPTCGWLNFQSDILFFHESAPITFPDAVLLSGEIVIDDNTSCHFREDGQGGMIQTIFKETVPEGDHYLVEDFRFLGTTHKTDPDSFPRISYRRYWKNEPGFGYRQFFARFTGFLQEENLS